MGAKRKPASQQRGDLRVVVMQQKKAEEEAVQTGNDELQSPPEWLDEFARSEWYRVVPQLLKIEIVGNLDYSNIAGYCNAFSKFRQAVIDGNDSLQIKYGPELRRFADQCGMTINSRLKAATTKIAKQDEVIEERFGVI